ncbi:MAG: hypothetical protein EBT48_01270 [Verrucomicrobia bacterium]|nr:hypothetical protein [Verrucomicrobiota bacterium]
MDGGGVGLFSVFILGRGENVLGAGDDASPAESDLWISRADGGGHPGKGGAGVGLGRTGGISRVSGECADVASTRSMGGAAVGKSKDFIGVGHGASAPSGSFLGYGIVAFGMERGSGGRAI